MTTADDASPVRRGWRHRAAGAVPAVLLLLAACSQGEEGKAAGRPAPAVPVTAAPAERRDVPVTLKAIGTVQAYNTVRVRPRVGGVLTRVAFREGQDVTEGDLLLVVDPRPFEAALASARADSARDAARAVSARATAQRYAELTAKDYVTQQQYDEATAAAAALEASVVADRAAIRNAALNLSFCSIRAPISGRTGNLLVRQGNLVKASDDSPLVVIQQVTPIFVSFAVPEVYLADIRRYAADGELRVEAALRTAALRSADPGPADLGAEVPGGAGAQVHQGSLTFIDNTVDRGTGTILLKATFANADEGLWPGQFVTATLYLTTRRGAVVVPAQAVQQGQQGSYVYAIGADQTATLKPVRAGQRWNGLVVVEEGVEAGEQVVTDGQLRLVPGAKVALKGPTGGAATP